MAKESLEHWLSERKKGIGGSDAAAILSEGYGCPRALYLDKSGVEPDYRHTAGELGLFERGHALEPLIADRFARETGMKVRRMPTRVSASRPWMRVNVDRMIESQPDGLGPGYLECKTASEHVFSNMQQEGMPAHYVLQVQHGLAVTGWQWGCFAVLEPYTFRFLSFRYTRNEALIDVLVRAEEVFWQDVQAGRIPEKLEDFSDARCEKCVYRRGCRNAEALPKAAKARKVYEPDSNPDLDVLVGNLKYLDAQMDDLDAQRRTEREKLQVLLGERTAVLVPGQGKKVSYDWQNGAARWDTRALEAERPELAERYKRRGSPVRALRLYDATETEVEAGA